ncbi:hypothetical protein M404DRAFT_15392 [Pisolithus tinctorius Marx 270]|uniref:2OGFeDO JBP1/TET oxygenase domain-containing protein n=1 Tax=Pisolithus tinctorius Marx 270 TaxID=870435 RepID=A0A0C3NX36_PISTI|nr:hypothetical protein M404DRAFT_15392 [Pisolithus tinctorius Marx 270]
MHWSWYNRHGTRGTQAPSDVHPAYLERADCSRTNHSQFLPYPSTQMGDHQEMYQRFTVVFDEVFEWIRAKLKQCLPEEYEVMSMVARALPGNAFSPAEPFTSIVLNINVRTQVHRDRQDREFCLVLAIGQFQGGSLVLVEPGLVLELRQGDFVVFRSPEVSHLNLDYTGERASLVLHTDREMDSWVWNQNGWGHNVTLKFFRYDT